jgi:thiosulfate/3-mercaptopyruvate sulfurtransferase
MKNWLGKISISLVVALSSVTASDNLMISGEEAVKLLDKPNVIFVSGDSHDVYNVQHIKGSVEMYAHHLHHADIMGHMHCAPMFMCEKEAEEYISSKGISNDTQIIAYDNFRGPNATGVYAFFKSFGHENIKILDGGMEAIRKVDPQQKVYDELAAEYKELNKQRKEAKKAGNKELEKSIKAKRKDLKAQMKKVAKTLMVVKGHEHIEHKGHYDIDMKKINWDYIVSKEEMKKASDDILAKGKDSNYMIIDTRGMTEIIGERKLDNVARGGHVPGATFLEWKHLTDFDKQLSYKDLKEVQKVFDKYGVTKDKTIYAYCHVGAGRSTHITTALERLGYENVKVYTGSWDEWGNDMNLPVRR